MDCFDRYAVETAARPQSILKWRTESLSVPRLQNSCSGSMRGAAGLVVNTSHRGDTDTVSNDDHQHSYLSLLSPRLACNFFPFVQFVAALLEERAISETPLLQVFVAVSLAAADELLAAT